jgi:tetratricopeptide (TPR) repeat protein
MFKSRWLLVLGIAIATAGGEIGVAQTAGSTKAAPANPAAIEQSLTAAVRHTPDSFAAHHQLAAFYLERQQIEKALPHLERAYAIDPSHDANAYDLGVALLQAGRLDAARDHVKRLVSCKETGEFHNLLGDIEEASGNLVAAAEEYQRAAHMVATEEHLFDWGNNLIQLHAYEPATEVFTAALARHPKSARLHVGLGIVQYSRGQYADAVRSLCDAVDLAPRDPRAYQFLGEMYGIAPEVSEEITRRLERFVKMQPRNALAHLHYALSLWKGQRDIRQSEAAPKIEALLRRSIVLDPKLAKGHLELGIFLFEHQRYADAIAPLRRAAALEPDHAQTHYRLAQAYQRTGQSALAAKELEIFERLKAKGGGV